MPFTSGVKLLTPRRTCHAKKARQDGTNVANQKNAPFDGVCPEGGSGLEMSRGATALEKRLLIRIKVILAGRIVRAVVRRVRIRRQRRQAAIFCFRDAGAAREAQPPTKAASGLVTVVRRTSYRAATKRARSG